MHPELSDATAEHPSDTEAIRKSLDAELGATVADRSLDQALADAKIHGLLASTSSNIFVVANDVDVRAEHSLAFERDLIEPPWRPQGKVLDGRLRSGRLIF